uniref:Late transcription factor 3-like protein n=1 Tax=Pithovirus LCPAC201 TaxID=2506591 RepID=A0A481Z5I4_9VIRU|nr:MAG: late transcription factor 3-like protein [Pithovirus LCPAC201]
MDELLRIINLVSQPDPNISLKVKSQLSDGKSNNPNSLVSGIPSTSISDHFIKNNRAWSTDEKDTTHFPKLTLQVKCDDAGHLNGLHISTSNSSSNDPNEAFRSSEDRTDDLRETESEKTNKTKNSHRMAGLNANVTGPIQAQISGRIEESSSGFQANLDFSISNQENSDQPPKCVWSSYDTGQSNKPKESSKFSFDDILNNLFSPSPASTPKIKQLPTLVGMMEEIMYQCIKKDTPDENKSGVDFNEDDDCIIYENKIVYQNDLIHGTYHTDVDIIRIDGLIRDNLFAEMSSLGQKRQQMESLNNQLNRSARRSEIICIGKDMEKLKDEICQIESNRKLLEYQQLANKNLKAYRKIGRYIQVINFGENAKIGVVDTNRLRIIMEYLGIARKYIKINLIHVEKSSQDCQVCETDLSNVYPDNSGMIKCPTCQVETHYLQPTQQESYAINNTGKSNYKDKETFVKGICRYEGKQKVIFPIDLIDTLNSHFISKGYPSKNDSTTLPLVGTVEGRRKRKGTSREMMMTALKDTSFSSHYEDCNLLSNLIWGSELPDLTMIRDRILRDYDLSQQVFNRVKGKRKSSLGSDYRLFRQLWHLGFPCHPSDFKIVTTPAIIKYYEEVWEKVCSEIGSELGWKPFCRIEVLRKIDKNSLRLPPNFN